MSLGDFERFGSLTHEDRALLDRLMVVEHSRPGQVFVREGDQANAVTAGMYVVLEGTVEVVAEAPSGGFAVKRTMGPGQMFGLVAFVSGSTRSATVRALTAVRTARLDRRTFDALFTMHAGVHARFQLVVARQLAEDIRNTGDLLAKALESGDCEPVAARFTR